MAKVLITIDTDRPSFRRGDITASREQIVAGVLDELQSELESGGSIDNWHHRRVQGPDGDQIGMILVSKYQPAR